MVIYRDKILFSAFLLSLFLAVIGFSVVYVKLSDVQHLLVIHFDSLQSIDFLGDKKDVFGIIISGAVLNIINFFLAAFFYYRERLLSYLLAFSGVLISLLILAALLAIIRVN